MLKNVNLELIKEAQKTIEPYVKRTPILECPHISCSSNNNNVFFKLETLQRTGSFKIRGAMNKILNLTEEERQKGVIASSAGNHAQGVALGSKLLGISSTIVMPGLAPLTKIVATKNYGSEVILAGTCYDDAYAKALKIQRETGATFIHPFDDPYVIAGQGTIGLEILEDLENVDVVIVPIGGGGIIAGIAAAIKNIKPSVKVIGVEPLNASSMKTALQNGSPCFIKTSPTIADGIAVAKAGELTFNLVREYVDEIVTVTEDEIAKGILFLLEKSKILTEGAGAASLAALLSNKLHFNNKNVCCVLSGGNADITAVERIINKSLVLEGRKAEISVVVEDRSGELNKLLSILTAEKANILNINQSVYRANIPLNAQLVTLAIECIDMSHIEKIISQIKNAGFQIR